MSLYTTGELAKLCNVSVRTVQYYDTRNILKPSELSEGGRRLYSEEDVKRMEIICFLRDAGISLSSIEELISEEEPEKVISILIEQQEKMLAHELEERQTKLELLAQMKSELKKIEKFSIDSIGDIAYIVENKKKLQRMYAMLVIIGLPLSIYECFSIIYGIITGNWWFLLGYVLIGIPYGDNSIAENLLFSVRGWWIFGIWVIALMVLFSTIANANTQVVVGTGALTLASYVAGLLPKVSKYVPTLLMDGNSLIYGMNEKCDYEKAFIVTIVSGVICIISSIVILNKKKI